MCPGSNRYVLRAGIDECDMCVCGATHQLNTCISASSNQSEPQGLAPIINRWRRAGAFHLDTSPNVFVVGPVCLCVYDERGPKHVKMSDGLDAWTNICGGPTSQFMNISVIASPLGTHDKHPRSRPRTEVPFALPQGRSGYSSTPSEY
jgi:hypothetical protein